MQETMEQKGPDGGRRDGTGTGMLGRFTVLGAGLDHPEGVAWDPLSRHVYAGGEAGQLYAVGLDGSVTETATTGGFILGVAVDGAGRIYACDVGRAEIVRIDPTRGQVETYSRGGDGLRMRAPNWLAFDPAGRLFVTDSGDWGKGDGFIWVVEPDRRTAVWTAESRLLPNGSCLDLDGTSLFVVETNLPGVVRIPIRRDGRAGRREVWLEMPGTTPDGLAIADDGTLLVACYRPDRIYAVSPSRTVDVLADDPHGQMFGGPANVAFAGDALDRLVTSNLGRWHVTIGDVGLRGPGLPRPQVA